MDAGRWLRTEADGDLQNRCFCRRAFFGVDTTASWDLTADILLPGGGGTMPAQGSIASNKDLWDGIVGIRGHSTLANDKWSVPYYFDVGTGSSELTWNAMFGLAYRI